MEAVELAAPEHGALEIQQLLQRVGIAANADLLSEFIATVLRAHDLDRGDLKLLHRTVRELRYAFSVYAAYRHIRKVTVFGSARTVPTSPVYAQARTFAQHIAKAGFMVITGAGNGIMKAAQEGAGRERSFGLNILLPFEQEANTIIANDPKLVYLKYFFTRKLLFVKETHAVALFPGGFGTHDEAFEALTLIQTGKSSPMPVVFLDAPGGSFWQEWYAFVQHHMLGQGLISPADLHLLTVTDSVEAAVNEITTFYQNYHSARYVGGELMIRVFHPVTETMLAHLNTAFQDILSAGKIVASGPLGHDALEVPELPRLRLWFDRTQYGRLRQMINVINRY